MGVVVIASILPDIDHPESMLGRHVKIVSIPLSVLQGDKSFLPWSEDSHSRGITHSIWMVAACFYIFNSDSNPYFIALAFGIIAHLIGDALTPAGIRLFWPLPTKFRSPIRFQTGGFVEYVFTLTLAIFAMSELLGFDLMEYIIDRIY